MKIKTKKQEIDIVKKKIIKITSIVFGIIAVVASIIIVQFVIRKSMMDPQINFVVGDCLYRTTESHDWQKAEVGMGDTQPLYKNDTEEGRRGNRRVEFMIVK